jgi:2-polyprenyl-3-methyl-5-hydroxy-6-metoxy-1,4-benzoquinol methylase
VELAALEAPPRHELKGDRVNRDAACILCGTPVGPATREVAGYLACARCDIVWARAEALRPSHGGDDPYYGNPAILEAHQTRESGMHGIVGRLTEICPARGRLLDVGAGVGRLMQAAASRGWVIEGVEPSPVASELARTLTRAPVHTGCFEDLALPVGHYDALTILDTLRHVSDPVAFLQWARTLLRPGGVLLVRETNRRVAFPIRRLARARAALGRRGSPDRPEYAQCFSPRSLLHAVDAAGFVNGWIEPSPVFAESSFGGALVPPGLRRIADPVTSMLFRCSSGRILISANVLAFARTATDVP